MSDLSDPPPPSDQNNDFDSILEDMASELNMSEESLSNLLDFHSIDMGNEESDLKHLGFGDLEDILANRRIDLEKQTHARSCDYCKNLVSLYHPNNEYINGLLDIAIGKSKSIPWPNTQEGEARGFARTPVFTSPKLAIAAQDGEVRGFAKTPVFTSPKLAIAATVAVSLLLLTVFPTKNNHHTSVAYAWAVEQETVINDALPKIHNIPVIDDIEKLPRPQRRNAITQDNLTQWASESETPLNQSRLLKFAAYVKPSIDYSNSAESFSTIRITQESFKNKIDLFSMARELIDHEPADITKSQTIYNKDSVEEINKKTYYAYTLYDEALSLLGFAMHMSSSQKQRAKKLAESQQLFGEYNALNAGPKFWSNYHLACINTLFIENNNDLTKNVREDQLKTASQKFLNAIRDLISYDTKDSVKQKKRLEIMAEIIRNPERYNKETLATGWPIGCPSLVANLKRFYPEEKTNFIKHTNKEMI